MRRLGPSILCAAIAVVVFGCNAILENEPGRLDRGASAGQGGASSGEDENGAAPISGGEPEGGTSGSSSGGSGTSSSGSSGDVGATPDAGPTCAADQKACGDLCVSVGDPFYGCSGPACTRCETPNATAACVLGACGVGACTPGFADCNALPADGCETSLATVTDCGGCGLACPQVKNADVTCVNGACTGTCQPGFGDCNGDPQDGCEKNLLKDRNNCGACGTRCIFGRCEQGACAW